MSTETVPAIGPALLGQRIGACSWSPRASRFRQVALDHVRHPAIGNSRRQSSPEARIATKANGFRRQVVRRHRDTSVTSASDALMHAGMSHVCSAGRPQTCSRPVLRWSCASRCWIRRISLSSAGSEWLSGCGGDHGGVVFESRTICSRGPTRVVRRWPPTSPGGGVEPVRGAPAGRVRGAIRLVDLGSAHDHQAFLGHRYPWAAYRSTPCWPATKTLS